jgi:hypothetical protein
MIPFKSPLLLTVPPTLEKRLEALAALRTLQAQDDELARQRRVEIAALRCDFDELQRDFATLRHRLASDVRSDVMRALKYNPDQPRVPAGQSRGGQWTSDGASGTASETANAPDHAADNRSNANEPPDTPGNSADGTQTGTLTPEDKSSANKEKSEPQTEPAVPIDESQDKVAVVAPYPCGTALMYCLKLSPGNAGCYAAHQACIDTGLETIFPGGIVGRKGG